ncbi:MAG: NADH-quinone oxidoreductase subunit H [Bdellovibrionaceae bacterium]|nr:NADH-quinone oxidoreductase subunit H [Bdellovibrionales bacterium]MCB9085478.1 NADH-quinone oxidoreductase subunit H [Pseudobdellovibrionaceae bacterium]
MGQDIFEISINAIKMVLIFLMMVQIVPVLVWVERRGSAFIQNRLGPNRIGPLGLTQLLADAVKFLFKEEFLPDKAHRFLFYGAPIVALIPGALAFGSIPLSMPIQLEPFQQMIFGFNLETTKNYTFAFQSFDIGIGIVFVLGVSSLGAYALLMAGWSSNNKFSLMGALRASAQMISYELALGLSLVGVLLLYNTFTFSDMIAMQQGPLTISFMGSDKVVSFLPNWGIFFQPLGAIIFFAATFAETNRLPFDLPEAEAELVAGYHTEYGGLKMLMFYIGEYGHMLVASALMVTFYFGGYNIPMIEPGQIVEHFVGHGLSNNQANVLSAFLLHGVFFIKVLIFLWIFIWVRWSLPRFRYDQLMDLGWKTMLPWALGNTIVTAVVILILRNKWVQ